MSGRDRPYHHGDLRAALLTAAVVEIEAVGVEHLSLRSLATELGVSPSAAYHHFADKDALIAAIALRAFEMLDTAVSDAVASTAGVDDPAARLSTAAMAYIQFAVDHPHLFRAAFSGHRPDMDTSGTFHPLLSQLLDDIAASGSAQAELRVGADAVVWAAVHGIATLTLEGYFRMDDVPAHLAVLERTMRINTLTLT